MESRTLAVSATSALEAPVSCHEATMIRVPSTSTTQKSMTTVVGPSLQVMPSVVEGLRDLVELARRALGVDAEPQVESVVPERLG